jgi:hypothetical protein
VTLGTSFHRYTRSLRFRFLVAWPRPEDLLLCAKHLFVAAMVAGVHPGLPLIGKSEDRRAVRQGQKQSVAVHPGLPHRSLAIRRLSRPSLRAGVVALRQTLVRRCHDGLFSSRANQNMNKRGSPRLKV